MNKKLLFVPFAAFILLVVVFFTQLDRNSKGDDPTKLESVLIGKPVPEFHLSSLDSEYKVYDQSLIHGEPKLLNVWATWCPTCYAEHQYLNKLASQGVNIVGVDYKDQRNKAIDWLNELGNPYQVALYDGDGMFGLNLGVYGAPETFLIDANGIIRYRHVGDVNQENWKSTLEPIYKKMLAEAKS